MPKRGVKTVKSPVIEKVAEVVAVVQQPSPTVETVTEVKATRATADCESAKEESCSCRCRGKYHGKPHPDGWKIEEGCEPLNKDERKVAKRAALYSWRKAHPERVSAYMKQWRAEKVAKEAAEQGGVAAEDEAGE